MRCGSCPITPGVTCHGGRHRWFCRYAATGEPERLAHVVSRNAAEEAEVASPTLATRAVSFAGAVGRFVASGFGVADEATRRHRMATCKACPRHVEGRCQLCGCELALKVASAAESCPDNPPRW
jgi:hypothetical protein